MSDNQTIQLQRISLADQIYKHIKMMILSGEIKGGQKIPEGKITKLFNVSRTPIREALKKLQEYGLIQIESNRYAVVAKIEPKEEEEISYIRAQLEIISVSQLIKTGVEEDFIVLERLADECDECLSKQDIASTFEKDHQFHLEIARRTGCKHLFEIYEKLDAKIQLLRLEIHLSIEDLSKFVHQHKDIVQSMRKRNTRLAKTMMKKHIMDQLKYHN